MRAGQCRGGQVVAQVVSLSASANFWPLMPIFAREAAGVRQSSDARARRSMLKRLNLGCADRRQKPSARRPDDPESGVADVEAGGFDMDEQARPPTARFNLAPISSPPPRDRALHFIPTPRR